MSKKSSVSSRDVAREAGVSQATVSYVLNNVKGIKIKPETRQLVLDSAKRLNYHPNIIARSMKLKKSMSIGIVTDKSISSYWFTKVLEGVTDVLSEKDYTITLSLSKSSEAEYDRHIQYYFSNRIDGIIFVLSNMTDEQMSFLMSNDIPFATINPNPKKGMIHVVKTELDNAIMDAMIYLKNKGIDIIGYMGVGVGSDNDRRYMGYLKALEKLEMKRFDNIIFQLPENEEEREEYIEKYLFERSSIPRAIICDTNNTSFKLLKFAGKNGIKIPEDMAVIGMGTSRFSDLSFPSLSSIEAPLYDMGRRGAHMLLSIIDDSEVKDSITLEWNFIERDSS